jgi:hypothetical protein
VASLLVRKPNPTVEVPNPVSVVDSPVSYSDPDLKRVVPIPVPDRYLGESTGKVKAGLAGINR